MLRVHPMDMSYFDTYTCKATNTRGVSYYNVTLIMVQKPGSVSSVQVGRIREMYHSDENFINQNSNRG